jgi:hypothetical protein
MKKLPLYTLGMGDRFGHQGAAQLSAVQAAFDCGAPVHPVWNKSNREHTLIGTVPKSLRDEADNAVKSLGWKAPYFVDADHINLHTVDAFIPDSDFFTIDVADYSGLPTSNNDKQRFMEKNSALVGTHHLPNLANPVELTSSDLEKTTNKFLRSIQEAGRIYRHIAANRPEGDFAIEVSIDETDTPQTPSELLLILAMISDEGIPIQSIAPKFTGRFNKGVDYVGDLSAFESEFDTDLAVIAHAIASFGLPDNLKISVHSGSDKFSLYPVIRRLISKHKAGLHLKTAGTTWLEELAGLAQSGGEGLLIAKEIYSRSLPRAEELIAPYKPVVDIDIPGLPSTVEASAWTSGEFVSRMEHNPACKNFNPQLRQFLHVSFKIAAEMGSRFTAALEENAAVIGERVRANLLENHIRPLFLQGPSLKVATHGMP